MDDDDVDYDGDDLDGDDDDNDYDDDDDGDDDDLGRRKRVIRENVELTLVACGRTTTRVLNPFDKLSYFHHHSKLFSLVAWFDFVLPLPSF